MIAPHTPTHPHGRPHAHADNVVRAHTQSHTHTHMRERENRKGYVIAATEKHCAMCDLVCVSSWVSC